MHRTRLATVPVDMVTRLWILTIASLVVLAALVVMAADAGAVSKRVKKACKGDYLRHCPAYAVGSPQLRTCMTKAGKRKQLSRRCLRTLIDSGQVPRKYLRRR